jgi:TIR domain-containing protein
MVSGVSEEHRFMSASQNSAHPEVFVSYASHDRERVMTVASSLQSHEVSLWLDQHRIAGGANWAREIVQAIRSCKILLLMCSNAAMRSRAVAQEVQLAWKYQLGYLPLLLERTSFPEQVEFFLEGCQWIEVLDRPTERWMADVLGALHNAGVFCSIPVHQGSSEKSLIRPRRPSAGLEGLWSMAKFTDRIWPLVVEGRSSTLQRVTYEVRDFGLLSRESVIRFVWAAECSGRLNGKPPPISCYSTTALKGRRIACARRGLPQARGSVPASLCSRPKRPTVSPSSSQGFLGANRCWRSSLTSR